MFQTPANVEMLELQSRDTTYI